MSFGALHKIVHPQGMNYDNVGILGTRQEVFVHGHPIEFVVIAAGEGICIIIGTKNLTQEFHDKTIPVATVVLIGSEVDLMATNLAVVRETRCRPCCVNK